MGFSGVSIWQLAIIVILIILLFGTKRLKNIGKDIGQGIRSLRKSLDEPAEQPSNQDKKD